jgi:hypothetical protein
MPIWRLFIALCLACVPFRLSLAGAATDGVTIVLSEEGGAHAQVANKLRASLGEGSTARLTVREMPLSALKQGDPLPTDPGQLWVAVGTGAMQALAQKNPPQAILNVLVPRAAFEKIAKQGGRYADPRRYSAIFLDQPWGRQFALIRLALPKRNRVGILLGPDSADLAPALRNAAKAAGLAAATMQVDNETELLPSLKKLLGECDVLLAVPDPLLYNRNTAQTILLTTYRHSIPLIGFSPSYVKAGALAAIYSLPEQIGHQAAETVRQMAEQRAPQPQAPRYFSIGVNQQVARSLELELDDETTLNSKLKNMAEVEP